MYNNGVARVQASLTLVEESGYFAHSYAESTKDTVFVYNPKSGVSRIKSSEFSFDKRHTIFVGSDFYTFPI